VKDQRTHQGKTETDPNHPITGLTSRKRALLKHILSRSGDPGVLHARKSLPARPAANPASLKISAPIPVVSRERTIPASLAQQRLWFLDQLAPGSSSFNVPVSCRHRGVLDVTALERSFQALVARHESLRTTFVAVDARPVQVISTDSGLKVRVHDLQSLPVLEREARAVELMNEEAHRPFDLTRDPLLRVTVLRLGSEDHILTAVIHHIVSDAWSIEVLYRDVVAFYRSFSTGRPAPDLPPLPIHYADFACWQRDSLQGETIESELSYWKQTLNGLDPSLDLPTDYPRPATRSERGSQQSAVVSLALAEQLRELSRQHGVTLFTALLTALQTLLHRYTGRQDIAVGTSVAGRSRAETEELIGFFVNTLVLRTRLSGDPTVAELLARTNEVTLGAFGHQNVPFDRVVEALQPERDPSRSPLFQVMFTIESLPRGAVQVSDCLTVLEHEVRTARFDLTLYVSERPDGLHLRFEYSTDLFRPPTIVRMLGHFRRLLEQMVDDPSRKVPSLELLTLPERQQLLGDWNQTETAYPIDHCLHGLFEIQVKKTPDAPAVVSEAGELTYRQLNRRANRLARRLQAAGVGPDVLVGLCVERSLEMVVGLLGILKAGGAYVPMDPTHPESRLLFVLENTRAPVLVTQRRWLGKLPGQEAQVVCLDDDDLLEDDPADDGHIAGATAPNHLAYVIYTSGSTGKPKGVLVEHRSVVNYVFGFLDRIQLDQPASFALVQPLTVDSSVSSVYPPLLTGGSLHVVSREQSVNPGAFGDYCARHPIDVLKISPSHLEALLAAAPPERILPRRCLVIGGEVCRRDWAKRLRAMAPGCTMLNHYGPTEATVGVTTWRLDEDPGDGASGPTLPIGRALPNTRLYVLDRNLQPQPVGVPGELYCGGSCLARGYLNLGVTNAQFIPDPFNSAPGARLYRTGDLVRWQSDGNIEFLSRVDHQVKVRGYRVEPGEVESALTLHPDVRNAVVVVRSDTWGHERLVGYVVPRDGRLPATGDVREFLRDRLPEYMVPSALMMLPELPRTPHGKVDRGALPSGPNDQLEAKPETIAPRDEVEARLMTIWEATLGVRGVGLQDSFFDLGGHSLLAVSLFSQIERTFGQRIPLVALFEAPTIEGLAAILRSGDQSSRWSSLVPLQPRGTNPPFFCVHANQGNVLFYRYLAGHMGVDQPFYGLQSVGLDGSRKPLSRVEEMASHYISEIRSVQPEGPYYLGGFCLGAYVALEMAHQLQTEGEEIALLVSLNTDGQWKTIDSFGEGIRLHARTLRSLDLRSKLRYVAGRLAYRVWWTRAMIARAQLRIQQIAKRPRTSHLLAKEVFEVNRLASASYNPSVFRGKLTYFQGSADTANDPRPLWNSAATDGVEIHVVPGTYIGVLLDPNVKVLADQLELCISAAKTKRL
jgi:amino acid adenylation domain-containing protein